MTSRNGRLYAIKRSPARMALLLIVLAVVLATASVAVARLDEFGGTPLSLPYAPYTAGPVVGDSEPEPYAPYTAGPVVREERPYAPYTAGPVVEEESAAPERIGNYLLR